MPTRRALLRGAGAAIAAAAGLGGGLVAVSLLPPAPRAARQPLRALSPRTFSILAAVADCVCPGTDTLPSAWELEVPEGLDVLLDRLHPAVAGELSQALLLIENPVAGTLLDGRVARFSHSPPEVQEAALTAFATSRIGARRQAYQALTGLINATYWSHPRTWAHVGYPGPPRFPQTDPGIPWEILPARAAPTPTDPPADDASVPEDSE